MSNACVTHSSGRDRYVPDYCVYGWSNHFNMTSGSLESNDRIYGWNESAYETRIELLRWWSTTPALASVTLAPWTWNWVSWSGLDPDREYYARIRHPSYPGIGYLGLTHHDFVPFLH